MLFTVTLGKDLTLPSILPMISKTGETRLSLWLEGAMISQAAQFDGSGFAIPKTFPWLS